MKPRDQHEQGRQVWWCKIGGPKRDLPHGADWPMRDAVQFAYLGLVGEECEFTFSGWGGELTEGELAVVEDRLPREESPAAVASPDPRWAEVLSDVQLLGLHALPPDASAAVERLRAIARSAAGGDASPATDTLKWCAAHRQSPSFCAEDRLAGHEYTQAPCRIVNATLSWPDAPSAPVSDEALLAGVERVLDAPPASVVQKAKDLMPKEES